jgi:hypothetical protein
LMDGFVSMGRDLQIHSSELWAWPLGSHKMNPVFVWDWDRQVICYK